MSAAFTAVTLITDWAAQAFGTELALAVYERKRAAGISSAGASSVSAGDDAQAASFWADLQDALEDLCTSYVNHTVSIHQEAAVPMFTLSSWRAEAGLSSSGFRRATTWPTDWTNMADPAYSFGQAQAGDIIGPWIFEDLQNGCSALQWTVANASPIDNEQRLGLGDGANCSDARQDNVDVFDAAGWNVAAGSWFAYIDVHQESGSIFINSFRNRCAFEATGLPTANACAIDVYVSPEAYGAVTFTDIDNLSFSEGHLSYRESLAEATNATRDSSVLGDYDNPVEAMPFFCPYTADVEYAYSVTAAVFILKWNFTNA